MGKVSPLSLQNHPSHFWQVWLPASLSLALIRVLNTHLSP